MVSIFNNIYKDRKVLITGHTGFKGSWLSFWLLKMGAIVVGYSLPPLTSPNHFDVLELPMESIFSDIRDPEKLFKAIEFHKPEIVFHMAAQPIVRLSYLKPVETYETNVMGTVNILDACRRNCSVRAIVNITSDKCYHNKEWVWGYRENDPMGGYDPYSSSKSCSELVTSSYRNSFFNLKEFGKKHQILLASARAGNVIGGGDWAEDRLIPDIMKAAKNKDEVVIRNPNAVRPWQHVLDPLSGYLFLGEKLLEGEGKFAEAWNFGPKDDCCIPVVNVVKNLQDTWDRINYRIQREKSELHEAHQLKLDCSKTNSILKWEGTWSGNKVSDRTSAWYKAFYENNRILTSEDLETYIDDAKKADIEWAILS
ncbi:MAG: CDP-glucose 4,6-dehydratase [Desulfobacteraceae bacterium]|nr:CDP-glucose 4,6-dehydratase [Desulfobacteraceae bacterium]